LKMDRIYLMELVRSRQVGAMNRRDFLKKVTAVLGSTAAANTLLAACTPAAEDVLPPVIDTTQLAVQPSVETAGGLATGVVTYPGPEAEELMGYLAYREDEAARPAVIVIQEWWGLNEHIKDVTERFAGEGFVALAPDLYQGVVTTEPNEARKLAMELSLRDAVAEIEQAIAYLKDQPFVSGQVGAVGFCMGGGLVLQTAVNSQALNAGVVFYGSPLLPAEAAQVRVPVHTFLGTADNIPVGGVEAMHAAFDEAGLENAYQIYEGAQHAFFNDTRSSYDPQAAADAWSRTLTWFRRYLST
jgi:carboxymethylenebutenolidase